MPGVASGSLRHFSFPSAHDHRPRTPLPSQTLRRPAGPGPRRRRPAGRRGPGPGRPRLSADRPPRRREDDRRAHARDGAQLPQPRRRRAIPAASARTACGSGAARPTSTWSRSTPPATAASTTRATCASGRCTPPPREGHYKVYIVDEAHMLTREAWNALLKMLEEPPPRRGVRLRHHRAAEDRGRRGAGAVAAPALRLPAHRARRHPGPAAAGARRPRGSRRTTTR